MIKFSLQLPFIPHSLGDGTESSNPLMCLAGPSVETFCGPTMSHLASTTSLSKQAYYE